MSDDDGKLFLYSCLGFCGGIYLFFKGFKVYRELRVVEDTPTLPIRSIPMGLVQVHGKAQGDQLVNSPVSNSSCHFYKVDIEKWHTNSKGGGSWQHYATDADGPLFYLEDETGKVLVDAHSAEYDLIQNARRETSGALGSLLSGITGSSTPGFADNLPAYIGSVHAKHAGLGLSLGVSGVSIGGSASGRFRLTEYLILPGHWYDIVGSCTENPSPKDQHDRNLIKKGQNEPTYLITWKTEKQEESTLRRRALLYIFGGAALSLVCAAIILGKLGLLF